MSERRVGEREPSLLLLSLPPPPAEGERKATERTAAVEITSAFVTINGSEEGGEGRGRHLQMAARTTILWRAKRIQFPHIGSAISHWG